MEKKEQEKLKALLAAIEKSSKYSSQKYSRYTSSRYTSSYGAGCGGGAGCCWWQFSLTYFISSIMFKIKSNRFAILVEAADAVAVDVVEDAVDADQNTKK